MDKPPVRFQNLETSVKEAFFDVWQAFEPLHHHQMIVRQIPLRRSTMRAQPVFNGSFWIPPLRSYRIDVSDRTLIHKDVLTKNLPLDVLRGWFAHELGHVMDYRNRSGLHLLWFGLSYVMSDYYRQGAEKKADMYAVEMGFAAELMMTKKYILEHADLSEHYKRKILKYYLGPDELEQMLILKEEEGTAPLPD